jgi:hypothetical protein
VFLGKGLDYPKLQDDDLLPVRQLYISPTKIMSILGLSIPYFFRQLFFGAMIGALTLVKQNTKTLQFSDPNFVTIGATLLYPYSRFLYEEVMRLILGNNVFVIPILIALPSKMLTMVLCWFFSIVLAPIAWIYIFLYRQANNIGNQQQVVTEPRHPRTEQQEPNDDWS